MNELFVRCACGADGLNVTLDRDYNASLNLESVAASLTDTLKTPVGVEGSGLLDIRASETVRNESGNEHCLGTGDLNG
jgi:hypothetical protein